MFSLRSSFNILKQQRHHCRTTLKTPYSYNNNVYRSPILLHPSISLSSSIRNMSSSPQTITEAIKEDHSELFEYYEKLTSPGLDEKKQQEYQNIFIWELARHSAGEELVVYPAMEKHLGEKGKKLADKDREQHAEIKKLLYDWESIRPSNPEFLPQLRRIWDILSPHNTEEETDDLPPLEEAIGSKSDSQKLGRSFNRTKMFVPTRAHPSMPQKPPFETAVGLLMAPLDKLTDLFRSFPEED